MLIIENIRMAVGSLRAGKMRALLTMLGIIIGIGSVIAIMTVLSLIHILQELLGHSDVSTTMNVYAHSTRDAKRKSVRLLDKVVGND